jgi:hypothetical protein
MKIRTLIPAPGWRVLVANCADDLRSCPVREIGVVGWGVNPTGEVNLLVWDRHNTVIPVQDLPDDAHLVVRPGKEIDGRDDLMRQALKDAARHTKAQDLGAQNPTGGVNGTC